MKWSAWAGLVAPFALLLLVLASVVVLPRVQATHSVGMHTEPATATTPAVVTLPAVIVTPKPGQMPAQTYILGGYSWPSGTGAKRVRPLTRAGLDLGMPYYSFASPVLITVKD